MTKIYFSIPYTQNTVLKLFDVLGKEVKTLINEKKEAGNYEFVFNGTSLSSGIYFYTLLSGDFKETKKMILMK